MRIKRNVSLLPYNTFGIEAYARVFAEYDSSEELRALLRRFAGEQLLAVGAGSNLLFLRDFEGIVLHSQIRGMEVVRETDAKVFLRVGAGETWDDVAAYAVLQGWGGAENLSLIPGTVGASVVQNIGAYGAEVKDIAHEVEALAVKNGTLRRFTNAECRFAYRSSVFKTELRGQYIVTYVTYTFQKQPQLNLCYGNLRELLGGQPLSVAAIRETVIRIRHEKLPDPKDTGNAGSFFTNPVISVRQYEQLQEAYPAMPCYPLSCEEVKVPAGWLIEQAGWLGRPGSYREGRAGVHEQQALVLINRGGASGAEIAALADQIRLSVRELFGIELTAEVIFV